MSKLIAIIIITVSVMIGFIGFIYGIVIIGQIVEKAEVKTHIKNKYEVTNEKAGESKYEHWKFLIEGTVVNVEYIVKPSTFGPDIKETILRFDDDRVYVIHNALASVVLNKKIRIYQFNYSADSHVEYEVIK